MIGNLVEEHSVRTVLLLTILQKVFEFNNGDIEFSISFFLGRKIVAETHQMVFGM